MMKKILSLLVGTALLAACQDGTNPGTLDSISAAFQSVPVGFDNAQHSFAGASSGDNSWAPRGDGAGDHRGPGDGDHDRSGPGHGPGFGLFMGGGLGGLFMGDGFGPGFGRGRGDSDLIGICSFDAGTGRITCDPVTRNGLTITRSAAYKDAGGNAQTAFNETTTNSINTQVTVSGTITRRRDSATSAVDAASDRTVSGLAPGSTQRQVDGTSHASENISGTDSTGHYTAVRLAGDTTVGVIIPRPTSSSNAPPYPTAGTITRSMQVTLTRDGQSPMVSSRREVITYDGSTTAKVTITQDGTTRNCTLPLPWGRISCS